MKLNRRGFFKRSARVGAALAVSPLLIGGKDGGTGPGTAVTAKAVELAPQLPDMMFESSSSGSHRYTGRRASAIYMGAYPWPEASSDLVGGRRHQKRDERGRFSRC